MNVNQICLKKNEEFSTFSSILNKIKNLKDKTTKIILVAFMVGVSEGVEGLMILTRRVAALPMTIILYQDDFLVHVVYTRVIFCFLSSWSM